MKKDNIPSLLDICREIDEGKFEMQEDEVITYYPSRLDRENDNPTTSSLPEILFLYNRRRGILGLLRDVESTEQPKRRKRKS